MSTRKISDLLNIDMPSLPPKKSSLNSFQSANIGGLGDIRLNAIRFKEYALDIRDSECWLVPKFDPEDTDGWFEETDITGKDLLVSLMNLYEAVNKPGVSKRSAPDLVAEWCSQNIHPYAHRQLIEEMEFENMMNHPDSDDDRDDDLNDEYDAYDEDEDEHNDEDDDPDESKDEVDPDDEEPEDDPQNRMMEQFLQNVTPKTIDTEVIN